MHGTHRRVAGVIATLSCAAALSACPHGSEGRRIRRDPQRAQRAVAYLAQQQRPNGVDRGVLAHRLHRGRRPRVRGGGSSAAPQMNLALAYLRGQSRGRERSNTIGLQAKVVMAVSAARARSADLRRDEPAARRSGARIGPDGHYDDAAVFDDALAVLALESTGRTPSAASRRTGCSPRSAPTAAGRTTSRTTPRTTTRTADSVGVGLLRLRLEHHELRRPGAGGHGHRPTGSPARSRSSTRCAIRTHGGWSYSASFIATDANSTSLVLQAYAADGPARRPHGAVAALRRLQYTACGACAYTWNGSVKGDPDVGATIGAVPAIAADAVADRTGRWRISAAGHPGAAREAVMRRARAAGPRGLVLAAALARARRLRRAGRRGVRGRAAPPRRHWSWTRARGPRPTASGSTPAA